MLYFTLRYLVRYRLKVVKDNIARSFPEKSEMERVVIVNNFYRHLSRQIVESIQFLFISEEEIKRRFVFDNIELLDHYAEQGRNMTAVIGHYGNWDWMASVPLWSDKFNVGTLYKRTKSKIFNKLLLKIRGRFGVRSINAKHTQRGLIALNRESKPNIVAFLADHNTKRINVHYWIDFLNQPTAVQSGWATLARRYNTVVLYLKINPIKPGHYIAHFETITEQAQEINEQQLIEHYMHRLEQDIIEKPEYWLWSHKRWKHKKTEEKE